MYKTVQEDLLKFATYSFIHLTFNRFLFLTQSSVNLFFSYFSQEYCFRLFITVLDLNSNSHSSNGRHPYNNFHSEQFNFTFS